MQGAGGFPRLYQVYSTWYDNTWSLVHTQSDDRSVCTTVAGLSLLRNHFNELSGFSCTTDHSVDTITNSTPYPQTKRIFAWVLVKQMVIMTLSSKDKYDSLLVKYNVRLKH